MLDGSFGIVSAALQSAGAIAPDQSPLAIPEGAMASVILANIWRGFPFVMISYWAAPQAIPRELYEAASVDGAGLDNLGDTVEDYPAVIRALRSW